MARIITKGLIGLEDLNTGIGSFTRATSTGGTQTLTKINLGNVAITFAVSPKSSGFAASASTVYLVTTGSSALVATLPTAVGASGQIFIFKKVDSGSGSVTVATTSSQTIDGLSIYQLTNQWQFLWVTSDGSNWQIINNN